MSDTTKHSLLHQHGWRPRIDNVCIGDCGIHIDVKDYRASCTISGCSTVIYTDYPAKSYLCSHHTRDEQFVVIGRDLRDKNKWSDRRAHFQDYLLHAQCNRYDTTAEFRRFRRLVKPFASPEFVQIPEDLKLAAIAEYDRRIDESVGRITKTREHFRPHENEQLLKRMILNPLQKLQRLYLNRKGESVPTKKDIVRFKRIPILKLDKQIHDSVFILDFPCGPTEEQELHWEHRLRDAYHKDHLQESAKAAKLVSECHREINRELKRIRDEIEVLSWSRIMDPGNSLAHKVTREELLAELWFEERELLEWQHQLVVSDPFRVPKPKVAQQNWIEQELQKLGVRRDYKYHNPDDEDAGRKNDGLLSEAPIAAGSPEVLPRRFRTAQAAQFALWLNARPRTEQTRILKLVDAVKKSEAGAVERLLTYRGIQKLLPTITVLDYDVPTVDVAKAYDIQDGTLRKRIFELLQSVETTEVV